jgi:hypothetical protein
MLVPSGDEQRWIDGGLKLAWRFAPILDGDEVCALVECSAESAAGEGAPEFGWEE